MYVSIGNHLLQLVHFGIAMFFLYFLLPRLAFPQTNLGLAEDSIAHALRGVCLLIIMGYSLILLKLFETPMILTIFLISGLRRSLLSSNEQKREGSAQKVTTLFYDWIDGLFFVLGFLKNSCVQLNKSLYNQYSLWKKDICTILLLIIIISVSFGIRFYDVYYHAAPTMSDSYVTLSWLKNAQDQQLFVDGIYPQGYYILLNYFAKFSAIDPLYVLRYSGPISNTLIIYCSYFLIARLSGERQAGIVASIIPGVFGFILSGEWERQTTSLSQEYSYLLVLPTLYFYCQWVKTQKETYYRTALAGACAVGLVHVIGYVYLCLGVGCLVLTDLSLSKKAAFLRFKRLCTAFMISAAASVTPAIIGLFMGKSFHANSLNFTFEVALVERPPIQTLDFVALGLAVFLILSSKFGGKDQRVSERCIGLLGIIMFFIYEYLAWLTQKEVIASRAPSLWALTLPLVLGMGASVFFRFLRRLKLNVFIPILTTALIFCLTWFYLVVPIDPSRFKMESDAGVEQYLSINQNFLPRNWMIIYSFREANNMIRGKGYHMYIGPELGNVKTSNYFLGRFDPQKPAFTQYGSNKPDSNLPKDVFIFYEKKIFRNILLENDPDPKVGRQAEYTHREQDMKELKAWLDKYQAVNGELSVYYDSDELTVYHFIKRETD